ncbi:Crp/Fnr family transcriptional regulator [Halomonas sp. MCCC 1A17488]|uniref:Crp/Fnr family transcriptional regulator n=1 Tax=Billgrantia sulfidoxydans TaxID=2733484 RepID=A0ABX7W4F3_9GAMM|nr:MULTISPECIES: Crp/Fnr family transcriptional regulator [Halomonas]MCE8015527.1 Crp/Fnr family transcriptional regulator [Halomonas sp. MCCC 1A17488]MCG3238860.1 Crp/Fnr family transcriptional regulator [Halomonas sp. MCCC 1A17488]QPP51179.1 Crp/Fnr family transcriptional regulator [Halomonas sp. SS10-MC5]QTP54746.1 Crp/Fnr family transcriptional regulator [Halomonas sulfidoxydans]
MDKDFAGYAGHPSDGILENLSIQNNVHEGHLSTAKHILEQLAGCLLPDWQLVEPLLRRKTLQPGDALFRDGVVHPFVYFVESGIIKMIYETDEGDAWVKAFVAESRFFASLAALSPGGVTSFSAIAACPAVVESLPYQILDQLADRHPQWQRALRRSFELYGFRKECRERDLLTLSAEERYRRFIEEYPHIAARLADRDIAGYVRVTPASLSRIKARIRQAHTRV